MEAVVGHARAVHRAETNTAQHDRDYPRPTWQRLSTPNTEETSPTQFCRITLPNMAENNSAQHRRLILPNMAENNYHGRNQSRPTWRTPTPPHSQPAHEAALSHPFLATFTY